MHLALTHTADIAVAASEARSKVVGDAPVVAFLSHSTKGSASGASIDVMREAGFQRHPFEWWHFSHGDQLWALMSWLDAGALKRSTGVIPCSMATSASV